MVREEGKHRNGVSETESFYFTSSRSSYDVLPPGSCIPNTQFKHTQSPLNPYNYPEISNTRRDWDYFQYGNFIEEKKNAGGVANLFMGFTGNGTDVF